MSKEGNLWIEPTVYMQRGNEIYRCVVYGSITLTRKKNSAAQLSCTIQRDAITVETGDVLALMVGGYGIQFYGYVVSTSKHGRYCDIVAYDQIYYMTKNRDVITYEGIAAHDLLLRMVDDYKLRILNPPHVVNTEFILPSRVEDNVTILDAFLKALELTKENTGKDYWLFDDGGALFLWDDQRMVNLWTRISFGSIKDYAYKESVEEMYNKIRLYKENQDGGREYFTAEDAGSMSRWGHMQYSSKIEESENGQHKAQELLAQKNHIETSLSVTDQQGEVRVRGGSLVWIGFYSVDHAEYIEGWFRVESVTHKFDGGLYTMDMETRIHYMDSKSWEKK